jgi:hypothetical protein
MTGLAIFAVLTVCGVISLLSKDNRSDSSYVMKVIGYVFILVLAVIMMVVGKAILGV